MATVNKDHAERVRQDGLCLLGAGHNRNDGILNPSLSNVTTELAQGINTTFTIHKVGIEKHFTRLVLF
jgi:hypothetical protein